MNYSFTTLISQLFRLLWTISFISKIIYPKIAFSWLRSFLLYIFGVDSWITKTLIPVWIILFFALFVEAVLIVFLSPKYLKSIYLNFFLIFVLFVLSVVAFILDIPGSCGCFGELFEWKNDKLKIIFTLVLWLGSFVLLILSRHKKNLNHRK